MIGYHLIVELGIAMTIEKLNRLAELGFLQVIGTQSKLEKHEYDCLIAEWKKEQDNKFDIRKLKVGDTVRHFNTGREYIIVNTLGGVVAAQFLSVNDPSQWTHA